MFERINYYQTARENEKIFRNILRDLKENREHRGGWLFIPCDIDAESSLEELFHKYSKGNRYGIFTITDFTRPKKRSAKISFEDSACLSGGGATLEYKVNEDNSVKYKKAESVFMH
jgi:hypothetical protein